MTDPPDDDDDTPLTAEELAEREKMPSWGGDIFARAIDEDGVLGDVLLEPEAKAAEKRAVVSLDAAAVREGAPTHREGEVWQTNGRYFTLKNGRTVPAAAPGKQTTPPPQAVKQKPTPPAPLTDPEREKVAQHVLPGLDEKIQNLDPTAAAKPGVLAWAHERAVNAMARVSVFILDNHAALGGILGAVLDTPDDLKNKFGYNPSVSSGGHASSIQDPTRDHLGISTHLAATIATHVLSAGIAFARKKMAGKVQEAAPAGLAELLTKLFGILSEEFEIEPPDPAAIAAALEGT